MQSLIVTICYITSRSLSARRLEHLFLLNNLATFNIERVTMRITQPVRLVKKKTRKKHEKRERMTRFSPILLTWHTYRHSEPPARQADARRPDARGRKLNGRKPGDRWLTTAGPTIAAPATDGSRPQAHDCRSLHNQVPRTRGSGDSGPCSRVSHNQEPRNPQPGRRPQVRYQSRPQLARYQAPPQSRPQLAPPQLPSQLAPPQACPQHVTRHVLRHLPRHLPRQYIAASLCPS